jgi:glycosyltransferase involved in cell wall biosynthesis
MITERDPGSSERDVSTVRRRLKVLMVIDGLGAGGAERSLAEMLPHVERAGVDPVVACFFRRTEGVQEQVLANWDVRFVEERHLAGRVRSIRRIIASERPDLVHTTLPMASLVGRLAAVGGPPVLSTLVSTSYQRTRLDDPHLRRSSFRLMRTVDGITARRFTDHFHAISRSVKQHAITTLGLPSDRITVVYRGRDEVRLGRPDPARRRTARTMLGLEDDDEVLVHLGRQEFPKGHVHLLDAFDRLAGTRPRLWLLAAGRQGNSSAQVAAAHGRMRHGDRVRFLGHRDDAPEVLAAGDAFVLPSLWEGLGCSLLEAMALGLPIVASDVPAIREVVEDGRNATLVPLADPAALADAIEVMLDDADRRRSYGLRSRSIFEERFTLTPRMEEMVRLYDRVVGSSEASSDRTASQGPAT